jgi:hypothetical protein
MRFSGRVLLVFLVVIAAVVALFFLLRRDTQAAFGPAVALCPGPDQYGYTCASGAAYAYIDATNDTRLYEDDGVISLPLPFPFIFYGTTYTAVTASSNGNLQFGNDNAAYANVCLDMAPAAGMGDLISPYWDDLDLRYFGYLETELVGEPPNRIFVVEWDAIPRYGNDEDVVTFAVQLFEGSDDIVFLYENASMLEGYNGRSATIGLQSEAQGLALQFGCNQPVVANATGIAFPHPQPANEELGQATVIPQAHELGAQAKGVTAEVAAVLAQRRPAGLARLQAQWLNQTPPLASAWQPVDLTGDGRNELLVLWHGARPRPELTELALFTDDGTLLLKQRLSTRETAVHALTVAETADLTGDALADVLLHDSQSGQLFVLTAASGRPELLAVAEQCQGSVAALDTNADGRLEIVRDGCETAGRVRYAWDGAAFSRLD